MKLPYNLSNVQLYSLCDGRILKWDEMKNYSSAFGVSLAFDVFPVGSSSVLTLSLSTPPGCSVWPLGDGSEILAKDTLTATLVPDEAVYISARKAHYLQRGDVHLRMHGRTNESQKLGREALGHEEKSPFVFQSTNVKIEEVIIP